MADSKLKEAMAEIKAVLQKHDIGGAMTLVSETHSEYLFQLEPSWSVIHIQADGYARFRSKRSDFKTRAEQKRCTDSSIHMVHQIRDLNALSFQQMEAMIEMLKQHFDIEHTPFADHKMHRDN